MLIGVPKEIKNNEYRVGLTAASVREVVAHGHDVLIESQAGSGINNTDSDYEAVGATIAGTAAEVFEKADMIVKVKEPLSEEYNLIREGMVIFTYFHFAVIWALMSENCSVLPMLPSIFFVQR